MSDLQIPPQKVIWTFDTANRLNPDTTDTNNFEILVDTLPDRFKVKKLALATIEMVLPQYIIEKEWQNVYFDEGVPKFNMNPADPSSESVGKFEVIVPSVNESGDIDHASFSATLMPHVNPITDVRPNPSGGTVITTKFPHGMIGLEQYNWGQSVFITGLVRSDTSNISPIPLLQSSDIALLSPTEFVLYSPPINTDIHNQSSEDWLGFIVSPQIPSPTILARMITFQLQQSLSGLVVVFDSDSTQFVIKVSYGSRAWQKMFQPTISLHSESNSNQNMVKSHSSFMPMALKKSSAGSQVTHLTPYVKQTYLSSGMGFGYHSNFYILLENTALSSDRVGTSYQSMHAKTCEARAPMAYQGTSKATIPVGDVNESMLGALFKMNWNRFWFDGGTEESERVAAFSRKLAMAKKDKRSLQPEIFAGLAELLTPTTGQGLPTMSEKTQMPIFIFTTPEGRTETFLVPFGQYNQDSFASVLGSMMTRSDGLHTYSVWYDYETEKFIIENMDGLPFDLEFDIQACSQMVMILGFSNITYRSNYRYESSYAVPIATVPVWGSNLFDSNHSSNQQMQKTCVVGSVQTIPQINTRSSTKKYEISNILPRPFSVKIENRNGPTLDVLALDSSGQTVYGHGLQVGDVIYVNNPKVFGGPVDVTMPNIDSADSMESVSRHVLDSEPPVSFLPGLLVGIVSAVKDAYRFSIHTGTSGSSTLDTIPPETLQQMGYQTVSLGGIAHLNLYFGDMPGVQDANPIKASYFGFLCKSYEWTSPHSRYISPLQISITPPNYLLMVIEEPANSTITHHTYKNKKKPNIFARLNLYAALPVVRMQEFDADLAGINTITKMRIAIYNPDMTLYQTHGCNFSGSIAFIGWP